MSLMSQPSLAQPHNRKRRASDVSESTPSKRGPDPNTVSFRLLCPAPKIGSIIGKGGEIVSRIRQETGARVKVEDPVQNCPERVILLSSAPWESEHQLVPAQSALLAILERLYFDDKFQEAGRKLSVRMLIDKAQTGAILGRGGSIITKMRHESGAFIKILKQQELPTCADSSADDLMEISGEYEDCRKAVVLVSHRLRENPGPGAQGTGFVRGPPQPQMYDPVTAPLDMGPPVHMGYGIDNPSLSTDGFTGEIETVFRLLCPDASIGCVIGRGGEVVKRIRGETGARLKVMDLVEGATERVVHCSSTEDVHSPVVSAIDALLRCIHCLLADQKEQQPQHMIRMLVPAHQIGAVLGKGGSTIKQIRSDTGAHLVVLPREKTPPCGDRGDEVLTVEGPLPSIMDAMSMVASLLRNNMIRTQGIQLMGPDGVGVPPPVAYPAPPAYPPAYPGGLAAAGLPTAVPLTLVSTQQGVTGYQLAPGVVDLSGHAGYQVVSVHGGHPALQVMQVPRTVQPVPTQHAVPPPAAPSHVSVSAPPPSAMPVPAAAPAYQQPRYTYVQTPQTWQPGTDPALTATGQVGAPMGNQPASIVAASPAPAYTYPAAPNPATAGHISAPPSAVHPQHPQYTSTPVPPVVPVNAIMTTVKLLIQQAQVGPLLGRSGANINYVRQGSGAKVKLHDPSPATNDRELEISGTYEQTQLAQRLVGEILTAVAAQGS